MSNFAPYDKPQWGSDVMVDALRALGLRYVSLNPGSSFRGLYDSLVNYGGDDITMIECPHEKIALGVAHGYAKVTGEPMAVVLHGPRRPAARDDRHLLRLHRPGADHHPRGLGASGPRAPAA